MRLKSDHWAKHDLMTRQLTLALAKLQARLAGRVTCLTYYPLQYCILFHFEASLFTAHCTIIFFANTPFVNNLLCNIILHNITSYCTPPSPILRCVSGVWRCLWVFLCFVN